MNIENRLSLAYKPLVGTSVGDAFGESFFGDTQLALKNIERREIPETTWDFTDDTVMTIAVYKNLDRHGSIGSSKSKPSKDMNDKERLQLIKDQREARDMYRKELFDSDSGINKFYGTADEAALAANDAFGPITTKTGIEIGAEIKYVEKIGKWTVSRVEIGDYWSVEVPRGADTLFHTHPPGWSTSSHSDQDVLNVTGLRYAGIKPVVSGSYVGYGNEVRFCDSTICSYPSPDTHSGRLVRPGS